MNAQTSSPMNFLKSDAAVFARATRQSGAGHTVTAQMSAERYLALAGQTVEGFTFKRWQKVTADGEMDRLYITWTPKRGRRVAEIGYIEVHEYSNMDPDAQGNRGVISTHIEPQLTEEMAVALAEVLS